MYKFAHKISKTRQRHSPRPHTGCAYPPQTTPFIFHSPEVNLDGENLSPGVAKATVVYDAASKCYVMLCTSYF